MGAWRIHGIERDGGWHAAITSFYGGDISGSLSSITASMSETAESFIFPMVLAAWRAPARRRTGFRSAALRSNRSRERDATPSTWSIIHAGYRPISLSNGLKANSDVAVTT